jgi:hypothetical protein
MLGDRGEFQMRCILAKTLGQSGNGVVTSKQLLLVHAYSQLDHHFLEFFSHSRQKNRVAV